MSPSVRNSYAPVKQDDLPSDAQNGSPPPRSDGRHGLITTLLGLGAIFLVTFYAVFSDHAKQTSPRHSIELIDDASAEPLEQCAAGIPPLATAPAPVNIWASLTIPETVDISQWLSAPSRGLNLTRADQAETSDNFIYLIEAYRPPKAAALAYLDDTANRSPPARYSRVSIHHGSDAEPSVRDYLVGPLPLSDETVIRPLTEIYHRDAVPFNARGYTDLNEIAQMLGGFMILLSEATQELFGAVARGHRNDTLVGAALAPLSFDGSFRRAWVTWRINTAGAWLHPVGFFTYIDFSGTDKSLWKLLKIVYNHQIFQSKEEFLEAFHNGTLVRLPPRHDQGTSPAKLAWSTRTRPDSPVRDLDELPGPRSVSFGGLRFRLDSKLQYISWMGWGMYFGFDRDMGLSLWDLRFKDERIIYELAPQEAIAQYAGNDPMQSSTVWLDRYFGMGSATRDLLPGYDCPHEAAFLPATTHGWQGSLSRGRAICIFEHDTGRPLTRHLGYQQSEFGAVKGYVLVVRSISTVGNYDYLFDYMFHLDGTIEVRLSASGYLQAGFWEPSEEPYGTAIRETTMGSLHDHVINYKVDLDVAGLSNSLLYTSTAQEEVTQPWFDDEDWGQTVIQQRITRTYIEDENDALLKFPTNLQGGYALVNKEAKNSWGSPRGYAIHPGYSPVHNTVVGSKRLLENANWARYNLAVSRRKDTEPTSSSMWNLNLPGDPMVNFHHFFDGENITQEDLVAWINVGTHHLPQAEDSPNTRTNLASSSFFLTPLNYFDTDVSMDSINAILLNTPEVVGDPWTYEDYGVKAVNCVPAPVPPFEYTGAYAFGVDGEPAEPASADEMRKAAEGYHGIRFEL